MKDREIFFCSVFEEKTKCDKRKKKSNEIYIILQFSFFDSLKRRHV